jgi:SAM-dependent methyltransferase
MQRDGYEVVLSEASPAEAADEPMFDSGSFADLAAAESDNFWFQARNRLIIWALERHFPDAADLLEVGCGTGFVLRGFRDAFPDLRLVGGDYYAAGLPFARERLPGVELTQLDARELPFKDEFDVVGAFDVIEHISDDERVLSQIARALRPGGGLLLTVPQHPWLWSHADDRGMHKRRYRQAELVDKARSAGFEVVRVTSFVSLLLPAMAASRVLDRRRDATDWDPMGEFKISPALNRTFGAVLDLERALIRAGVSLPVGGSLLLVARLPEQTSRRLGVRRRGAGATAAQPGPSEDSQARDRAPP